MVKKHKGIFYFFKFHTFIASFVIHIIIQKNIIKEIDRSYTKRDSVRIIIINNLLAFKKVGINFGLYMTIQKQFNTFLFI